MVCNRTLEPLQRDPRLPFPLPARALTWVPRAAAAPRRVAQGNAPGRAPRPTLPRPRRPQPIETLAT